MVLLVTNLINVPEYPHFAPHVGLSFDSQDIFGGNSGVDYFIRTCGESEISSQEHSILRGVCHGQVS